MKPMLWSALARLVAALGVWLVLPSLAGAQQGAPDPSPARTVILRSVVPSADMQSFGRAVERVVRARADELGVIDSAGTPALELGDIQLVVGCLNETVECYRAITAQLEVEALMLPSIERADHEVLVTIMFYDDRAGEVRRVIRGAAAEYTQADLIASIDGILRELFGLPPASEPEGDAGGVSNAAVSASGGSAIDTPPAGPDPAVDSSTTIPVVPIVVAGVGLAVLGAALVLGAVSAASEDAYLGAPTSTPNEVDAALRVRDRAQTEALIANIGMGVGAATVLTGAVLFILMLPSDDSATAGAPVVRPYASPNTRGWTFGATLGGHL